jgi:hypothetical protein
MAIIYTYPTKATPALEDLILISDISAKKLTKNATIASLKETINVVDSLNSLTGDVTITGGTNITLNPSGNNIEINSSGGSGSGTGGFETLPFATANGYISGETSVGTYVFQMIAPSNCAPTNFKFYNFLAQSVGRTTTVAIYKGVIGDEGAAGSLQSTGQIAGTLGAAQISGAILDVEDGATAISAGDNIVICFSIDEEIQPLGVIPITASGGTTLTNASPVSNNKLAIHDPNVSLTAAQIQASATTVTALEALLTSSSATTSKPFLLIY